MTERSRTRIQRHVFLYAIVFWSAIGGLFAGIKTSDYLALSSTTGIGIGAAIVAIALIAIYLHLPLNLPTGE